MSAAETFAAMPFVQPTAWALLHSLWQGGLLSLALAAALSLLRGGSPRLRYAAALAALFALPVLVLATGAASSSTGAALSPAAPSPTGAAFASARSAPAPAARAAAEAARAEREGARRFSSAEPAEKLAGEIALRAPRWSRARAALRPALPWLFAAWLCGVAMLSAAQLMGWFEIHRRRRSATRPLRADLRAALPRLCRRLGIRRPVALLESAAVAVPAVVGWLRPLVLVPASALAGLTPQQLELILAHELAHVRRHDYLVNLMQAVVETLFFYHPAVWWMSRQVRREREHCCDDLAVAACGDRVEYARALAVLAGLRAAPPRLAPAATSAGRGVLLARIRRLIAPAAGAGSPRAAYSWLAGGLGLGLLAFGAAGAAAPLLGAALLPGLGATEPAVYR
jgi:beta-lactamase regulating signal transducer with metallopeptidase domain